MKTLFATRKILIISYNKTIKSLTPLKYRCIYGHLSH